MANLTSPSKETISSWIATQNRIAGLVIETDDVSWRVNGDGRPLNGVDFLFCAGADVSFSVTDPYTAVATLTVVRLPANGESELVYSGSKYYHVATPYAPTFLAFRECPLVIDMLQNVPLDLRNKIDLLLLDGNGVLHPRSAGLACHVAIEAGGLPTIGVAKTLMCIDGLTEKDIREKVMSISREDSFPVMGRSGRVWANALLTGNAQSKPLYVSIGHRISLATATSIVKALCIYRVPEPIRIADFHSREALRGNKVEVPFISNDS